MLIHQIPIFLIFLGSASAWAHCNKLNFGIRYYFLNIRIIHVPLLLGHHKCNEG